MRASRLVMLVLVCAVVGFSLFGVLAWRAISIEQADEVDALRQFSELRATLGRTTALVEIDQSGRIVRLAPSGVQEPARIRRLNALAYRAREQRLVRASVPFWFFKLKGPAAQFALRGTGVDLDAIGLTPADIEQHGPGVVLDQTRANGDRLLVWVE